MTTPNGFLDIHVLHSVPLSNLNRDNLGSPKQVVYGGVTRSRISSQCTKRAARLWLEDNTDLDKALRTRHLPQVVREHLVDHYALDDGEACEIVIAVFAWVKQKANDKGIVVEEIGDDDAKHLRSKELTFTTTTAAADLANSIMGHRDDIRAAVADNAKTAPKDFKAELFDRLGGRNTIIALCGRMLANLPGSNVDGALQVAHAFTTHASNPELDYFTAVDDQVQDDGETTGAGHINVNEFTSGVFYRHATIGLGLLAEALDGSAEATGETAASLVRAFTVAEPTGKQNAANAHTVPALIAVTLRSDRPVSLATAFESPVGADNGGGFMSASAERLATHSASIYSLYGTDGLVGAWHAVSPEIASTEGLGERTTGFDELVAAVAHAVRNSM